MLAPTTKAHASGSVSPENASAMSTPRAISRRYGINPWNRPYRPISAHPR
jgi:hypothetical protein